MKPSLAAGLEYGKWGWAFDDRQLPRSSPTPGAFVRWEDNHYESEADSAEALLLMALRNGQLALHYQRWCASRTTG